MKRHGIRKQVHGKTEEEGNGDQGRPVFLNRIPEQEQDIYHGVDASQDVQVVENQYLGQDKAYEADGAQDIVVSHPLFGFRGSGFPAACGSG